MQPRLLLLLSLLLAVPVAALGGDPIYLVVSAKNEQLTKNNCVSYQTAFACGELKKGEASGPTWKANVQRRCSVEPYCPPAHADVPGCMKLCEETLRHDQTLICDKCPAIMAAGTPVVTNPGGNQTPPGNNQPDLPNRPIGGLDPDRRVPTHGPLDPYRHGPCGSNEECFKAGAEAQRRAELEARERQREYWRSMNDARNNQLSTITGASDMLSRWKSQMDQNPAAVTADERARFQSDQRLVQQAHAAMANPSAASFTGEDALRANDPSVMRNLSMATENAAQMRQFEREEKVAKNEAEHFHALAVETTRRGDTLRNLPVAQAAPAKMHTAATAVAAAGGLVSGAPVAGSGNRSNLSAASKAAEEKGDGRGRKGTTDASGLTQADAGALPVAAAGAPVHPSAEGLRELLRKRLEARARAGAADDSKKGATVAAAPEGAGAADPGAASASPAETSAGERAPASRRARGGAVGAALAEEVMAGLASSRGKGFSMNAAESDAEVRRLLGNEPEVVAGLLGRETASLFERVRHAVRSCLERDCVAR